MKTNTAVALSSFIIFTGCAIASGIQSVKAQAEKPVEQLNIWQIKRQVFAATERFQMDSVVTVYKFQVGNMMVCRAFVAWGNSGAATLGDVPCE